MRCYRAHFDIDLCTDGAFNKIPKISGAKFWFIAKLEDNAAFMCFSVGQTMAEHLTIWYSQPSPFEKYAIFLSLGLFVQTTQLCTPPPEIDN